MWTWTTSPSRRFRGLVGITVMAATWVVIVVQQVARMRRGLDPWQHGDWLINYSGGFVRRGLVGQLLSYPHVGLGRLLAATTLLQLLLALILFTCIGVLFLLTDRRWAWLMLVMSPAVLLFPVLAPDAALRKEVIALAALGVVGVGGRIGRPTIFAWAAFPLFVLALLSHEGMVVTLPAFLILLWPGLTDAARRPATRLLVIAYSASAAVALASAAWRPGDKEIAAGICADWTSRGIRCDGGALAFLPLSSADSVHSVLQQFPAAFGYAQLAALAAVPLFAVRFLPRHWLVALIVAGATLPLFVLAIDYGRWIYLISTQLAILALSTWHRLDLRVMAVPGYAVAAFCLLWSIPHSGPPTPIGLLTRWATTVYEHFAG